jgi:hypothetical protein
LSRMRARAVLSLIALLALVGSLVAGDDVGGAPCAAGVPAYFYPYPGLQDWAAVLDLNDAAVVIVNPASGPGAHRDDNYLAVLNRRGADGPRLYGYVDTAYGDREPDLMVAEAKMQRRWYGVSGIFLDQTAPDSGRVEYYEGIIRRLQAAGFEVAINPGQPDIDRRYLDLADHVVTFEGPYGAYREQRFPSSNRDYPPEKVWHLIYEVPDRAAMEHVVRAARDRGAGLIFVTDRTMPNPWDGLPPYWNDERRLLAECD